MRRLKFQKLLVAKTFFQKLIYVYFKINHIFQVSRWILTTQDNIFFKNIENLSHSLFAHVCVKTIETKVFKKIKNACPLLHYKNAYYNKSTAVTDTRILLLESFIHR